MYLYRKERCRYEERCRYDTFSMQKFPSAWKRPENALQDSNSISAFPQMKYALLARMPAIKQRTGLIRDCRSPNSGVLRLIAHGLLQGNAPLLAISDVCHQDRNCGLVPDLNRSIRLLA